MASNQTITIQQCLHGYENGHKLLSSSINFPKQTQSQLLKMSDASITGYSESSSAYLTGYPLKEIGAYALAKTWPAPEMSRPGCVWTHTIIIDYADLAQIIDAEPLLDLFEKPIEDVGLNYKKEISYNSSTLSSLINFKNDDLRFLMNEIYTYPNESVNFPHLDQIELLVLQLWSQQWPKLRRSFTFRTLSTSSSAFEFDLNIRHKGSNTSQSNILMNEPIVNNWLELALKDAQQYPPGELRKFLWRYGASCIHQREAFIHLIVIYNYMYQVDRIEGTKKALEHCIKWSDCSVTIFLFVLNELFDRTQDKADINLWKVILNILSREKGFDEFNILLIEKLSKLIEKNKIEVVREVLQLNVNIPSIVFEKIIYITPLSKLERLLPINNFDIYSAFKVRRDVCVLPLFWKNQDMVSQEVIDAIDFGDATISEVAEAIFLTTNYKAASELVSKYESKAVVSLLEVLIDSNSQNTELWLNILLTEKYFLVEALYEFKHIPLGLLANISKSFYPSENIGRNFSDVWVQLIDKSSENIGKNHLDFAIFLLERALSGVSNEVPRLISLSLDTIAEAICAQGLRYEQWRKLERVLPDVGWLEWDKCEILLKGVCLFLKKNHIDIDDKHLSFHSTRIKNRMHNIYLTKSKKELKPKSMF